MALDYEKTAKDIIAAVGGADNIATATNCMTRLRLVLNDESKADDDKVKAIKGVKGVAHQGGQYQIIIGNEVAEVMKEVDKLGNFSGKPAEPVKAEGNVIQRLFGFIAGCMTPLLPGLLGCGMLKVVLVILTQFCGLSTEGSTYLILNGVSDCFFTFLPIFLAYQIAVRQGGTPVLYMAVAAAMVYPDIVTLMAGGSLELGTFLGMDCTYLFGLPVICTTYTSSVLPILLMAPVMKYVEKFADWVSPNLVKAFLKPLIFMIICCPVCFYVLGPIGGLLGQALSGVFNAAYTAVPWLTIGVLSAIMPFIVMTGMHYALTPLCMNNLALLGFDALVMVTMYCSNLAEGGAAFGVAARTKDTEIRSEGIACGISACVAGVTEPAMYGINMRFVKPLVSAVIAAGISGLVAGLSGLVAYTIGGSPSLFSIVTFIGGDNPTSMIVWGIICAVLSIGISFIFAFLSHTDPEEVQAAGNDSDAAESNEEDAPKPLVEKIVLSAPLSGKVEALKDVPDEVFASGALGEGVAIIPSEGKVVAPCDCTVSATMDTKHAVGLTTPEGVEILIHVGLDTVELNGQYFDYKIKDGDEVKKGDVLMTFDMDGITSAGYKLDTPVLVSNAEDYVSVVGTDAGSVTAGDDLLTVV